MKEKYILAVALVLIIGFSQISNYQTITDDKKIVYRTNNYETNDITFKNQSYDLIEKLRDDLKLK